METLLSGLRLMYLLCRYGNVTKARKLVERIEELCEPEEFSLLCDVLSDAIEREWDTDPQLKALKDII